MVKKKWVEEPKEARQERLEEQVWRALLRRKPRIARLQRGKVARPAVFVSGVMPSALYGAEVASPPREAVRALRSWALRARRQPVRGVRHEAAFALLRERDDPASDFVVIP